MTMRCSGAGVIATLRDSFDIVGQEAADVPGSVAMIAQTKPQVVLLDACAGGEGGGGAEILAKSRPYPLPLCFWRCRFRMRRRMWGRVIRAGAPGLCDQDDYRRWI